MRTNMIIAVALFAVCCLIAYSAFKSNKKIHLWLCLIKLKIQLLFIDIYLKILELQWRIKFIQLSRLLSKYKNDME